MAAADKEVTRERYLNHVFTGQHKRPGQCPFEIDVDPLETVDRDHAVMNTLTALALDGLNLMEGKDVWDGNVVHLDRMHVSAERALRFLADRFVATGFSIYVGVNSRPAALPKNVIPFMTHVPLASGGGHLKVTFAPFDS